ncbi:unnamed protein product [Diabrotica balteata]|uniref:Uncharacterized protein n=1 Tax=Diabrotica balteata TaxID=107213 RepID=A0A9N9XAY3_DIABA|nr:unnamed protein product [Diabrotica balteata]
MSFEQEQKRLKRLLRSLFDTITSASELPKSYLNLIIKIWKSFLDKKYVPKCPFKTHVLKKVGTTSDHSRLINHRSSYNGPFLSSILKKRMTSTTTGLKNGEFELPLPAYSAKYINVCKAKETDISKCIMENIENIRPKLDDGIPELGIPSINPLKIPFAELNIGKEFKSSMKDIKMYGINTFIVKDLKVDLDNNYLEIKVNIPHIRAEGEYNVKGKLLILTLDGSGPGQINITNLEVTLIGHGVRETKHGKTFLKISSIDITPIIGIVNLRLNNLFNGNPELTETSNKVLNENQEVLKEQFAPPIVHIVEGFMSTIISNFFDHFPIDKLFQYD